MKLVTVDWAIIAAYFVMSLLIGLYYARRAGRSTEEYFLSDRSMPWWLAGTSMVATACCDRNGGAQRSRRQLALVVAARKWNAYSVLFCAFVAACSRDD